jgi:HipA-like protein
LFETIDKLWKSEGQESFFTPKNFEAVFELWYKELMIGILSLKDEIWSFQYSEAFKQQDRIKPLPDFPDVNKVYQSKELYPFFIQRIPSLNQPKVKETIKKEKIDEANIVELLKRFGQLSINNPFKLTMT